MFSKYRRPSAYRRRYSTKRRATPRIGSGKSKIPRNVFKRWQAPFLLKADPVPAFEYVIMTYGWRTKLSTSASAGFVGPTETFILNKASDPRAGTSSVNVIGFDNMSLRYQNYCVTDIKVDVRADVLGSTAENYLIVNFYSSGNTTTLAGQVTGTAQALAQTGWDKLSAEGDKRCHVQRHINVAKLFGVPAITPLINSEFWGDGSTGPNVNNEVAMTVGVASASTTATSVDTTVGIYLTMKVKWFNRIANFTS